MDKYISFLLVFSAGFVAELIIFLYSCGQMPLANTLLSSGFLTGFGGSLLAGIVVENFIRNGSGKGPIAYLLFLLGSIGSMFTCYKFLASVCM